jgi:hypothetical protein
MRVLFLETFIVALLIITTILWAFSFSLIGEYLAGTSTAIFGADARGAGGAGVPAVSAHPRAIAAYDRAVYAGGGDAAWHHVPAGFRAYLYLTVSEFLLFTVFTPLYITLIYDLLSGRRCAGAIC